MNLYTFFGSTKHKETDSLLRQGAAVTFCGESQLDLRESELAYDEVILNVVNALGATTVMVPGDWAIDSTLLTLFGETKGSGHNPQTPTRRLRLQGLCLFGEVRIERGTAAVGGAEEEPAAAAGPQED